MLGCSADCIAYEVTLHGSNGAGGEGEGDEAYGDGGCAVISY